MGLPDRVDGTIMALDIGRLTGWAIGRPGARPESGTVRLAGDKGQTRTVAAGNMIAWLDVTFRKQKPALVMKERAKPLQAFANMGNSQSAVQMTYGLHTVVEGMCARFGVPWHDEDDSRIRKHFLGIGRLGDRKETKLAVIRRCKMLGYVDRVCMDEDRCDALAGWDWACAHIARIPPAELVFFAERPAP